MIKKNSSAKWIGEDRYFFIPFWIPLASTLGATLARRKKRRHDEGMTKAERIHVWYSYTKKDQNQGATFERKKWHYVAPDDNNNNNRGPLLITPKGWDFS